MPWPQILLSLMNSVSFALHILSLVVNLCQLIPEYESIIALRKWRWQRKLESLPLAHEAIPLGF